MPKNQFHKNSLASVVHKILNKMRVVLENLTRDFRDMLIFPLIFRYKTTKKGFNGPIPVFKCPYIILSNNYKKSQFLQVQKIGISLEPLVQT